jgi:hypothetical protein
MSRDWHPHQLEQVKPPLYIFIKFSYHSCSNKHFSFGKFRMEFAILIEISNNIVQVKPPLYMFVPFSFSWPLKQNTFHHESSVKTMETQQVCIGISCLTLSPPAVKTQCLSQCQAFQRLVRSSHTLVNWIWITFDLLNRFSISLVAFFLNTQCSLRLFAI